jgi:dihydropteroate synthase-like protein
LDSGADIIDVGAIAEEDNSARLAEIVKFLKNKLDAPVSIDSLNPKEINSALDAGADLVLSLTSNNISVVQNSDNSSYVLIPNEHSTLDGIIEEAGSKGFKNILADPILHPPFNVAKSLLEYSKMRKRSGIPLMMGASNVVELMDVDSIGVNGLLAAIAVELDISLILTTENSEKTRNSVREMRRALDICFLAKEKGTLPKDLGINLLLAKAKNKADIFSLPDLEVITAVPTGDFVSDPKGHFKINVDFDKNKIIAMHCKGKCDLVLEGDNAEAIVKSIVEQGLVSRLDHAAYLGRELQKAEMYLKLKKTYVQDEDFAGL